MATAKKHYRRHHHKDQARVPDSLTADELQEVVSQALWEWGISKRLLDRTSTFMPEEVLVSAFRVMALGGKAMDAGNNKAADWLSPKARDWYMVGADKGSAKVPGL
jgi:hypothetical protein